MALKNKDGTPFKLFSKPNPLMDTQKIWSKDEPLIIHNLSGEKITLPDQNKGFSKEIFYKKADAHKEFIEDFIDIKNQEKKEKQQPEKIQKIEEKTPEIEEPKPRKFKNPFFKVVIIKIEKCSKCSNVHALRFENLLHVINLLLVEVRACTQMLL